MTLASKRSQRGNALLHLPKYSHPEPLLPTSCLSCIPWSGGLITSWGHAKPQKRQRMLHALPQAVLHCDISQIVRDHLTEARDHPTHLCRPAPGLASQFTVVLWGLGTPFILGFMGSLPQHVCSPNHPSPTITIHPSFRSSIYPDTNETTHSTIYTPMPYAPIHSPTHLLIHLSSLTHPCTHLPPTPGHPLSTHRTFTL